MSDSSILHPAALDAEHLLRDCTISFGRRGGPGGQHRNKVETAVIIEHRPTALRAEAAERRSQQANRQVALFRLRMKLALSLRLPVESEEPSSPCWRGRLRGQRLEVSPRHEDFPTLLAESLDRIVAHRLELAPAAAALGVSTSQLVRLLRLAPPALVEINRQRALRGMPALH